MTVTRTTWIIFLIMYLVITPVFLLYAEGTFYSQDEKAFNEKYDTYTRELDYTDNNPDHKNMSITIITGLSLIPSELWIINLILIVIPFAILAMLLVQSFLPTVNSGS